MAEPAVVDELNNLRIPSDREESNTSAPVEVEHPVPTVSSSTQDVPVLLSPPIQPSPTVWPHPQPNSPTPMRYTLLQLVMLLIRECIPFSIVEQPTFRAFLQTFWPHDGLPSAEYLTNSVLPELHVQTHQRVVARCSRARAVALTANTWQLDDQSSWIGVQAHLLTDRFDFTTVHLHSAPMVLVEYCKSGRSEWMRNVWRCFGEADQLVQLIAEGPELHIPPFLETFDYAIEQSFRLTMIPLLRKLCDAVLFLYHQSSTNVTAQGQLLQLRRLFEPELLFLHRGKNGTTSWRRAAYLLRLISDQSYIIVTCQKLLKVRPEQVVQERDWLAAAQARSVFQPLENAVTVMVQERWPGLATASMLLQKVIKRTNSLRHDAPAPQEPSVLGFLSRLNETIVESLDPYLVNDCVLQALLLDPRYKHPHEWLVPERFDGACTLIQTKLTERAAADELQRYLEMPVVNRSLSPLLWWAQHQNEMPNLAQLARMFHCMPSTSIPCDQFYDGDDWEKRRRLQGPSYSEKLFVRQNYDLQ